jgi:ABC-type branched-subunit amino acid transport system substrate-binding protein
VLMFAAPACGHGGARDARGFRASGHGLANNAPTDPVTDAATSGAQSGSKIPVQGVTENEIRFGISAPFSGAARELGHQMKMGIEAAFNMANTSGGVNGRQLRLVAVETR